MNMMGTLRRVVVKRPMEAFRSQEEIQREWEPLGYLRPPDFQRAVLEHEQFVQILSSAGALVDFLPSDHRTGLDSIYAHDPVLNTPSGVIVLRMGKPARRGECEAFQDALQTWEIPVLGVLEAPATAEAGDMIWLDPETLVIGQIGRAHV